MGTLCTLKDTAVFFSLWNPNVTYGVRYVVHVRAVVYHTYQWKPFEWINYKDFIKRTVTCMLLLHSMSPQCHYGECFDYLILSPLLLLLFPSEESTNTNLLYGEFKELRFKRLSKTSLSRLQSGGIKNRLLRREMPMYKCIIVQSNRILTSAWCSWCFHQYLPKTLSKSM